jgi:phenylalanyl-tRNA synthetase beta chain
MTILNSFMGEVLLDGNVLGSFTPANDLVRSIKGCDKDNIVAVRLFDRFVGQGVPEGQVSLAVEVTLQPSDKSYSDDDLKAISDKVIAAATKLGAVLRG